jgi:hypothetical protein
MVLGAISASTNALYTDTFTGDGTETDYSLGITPVDLNAIEVYLNGLYQNVATLTLAANVVTFATPPPSGVIIEIRSVGFLNSGGTLAPATLIGGTGIEVITNSPNNFTINNTLVDVTVSFNAPTGQSLTYTTPGASSGQAGSIFPTTTFTVTKSGYTLSGTAVITGLPAGITSTQSYNNTGINNILTITLSGVYPSTSSVGTNLVISNLTVVQAIVVDYLVVAGGGGGAGTYHGGGGGAGGLRTSYGTISPITLNGGSMETASFLSIATPYSLTVGGGGAGGVGSTGNPGQAGSPGSDSVFNNITSSGGGYGGPYQLAGGNGGSGGGESGQNNSPGVGQAVTSPVRQGFNGGLNAGSANDAGGGGGAGEVGGTNGPGQGGDGIYVNILNATNAATAGVGQVSSSNVYYAGGAGGAPYPADPDRPGGIGGGGIGKYGQGTAGTPNTGGGGGGSERGGGTNNGGVGGSGVVILRYPNIYTVSGLTEATGSPFTEGTDKVSVFTSGTGNIQFN